MPIKLTTYQKELKKVWAIKDDIKQQARMIDLFHEETTKRLSNMKKPTLEAWADVIHTLDEESSQVVSPQSMLPSYYRNYVFLVYITLMPPAEIPKALELLGLDWFRSYVYFTMLVEHARDLMCNLSHMGKA